MDFAVLSQTEVGQHLTQSEEGNSLYFNRELTANERTIQY